MKVRSAFNRGEMLVARFRVEPTETDVAVAKAINDHTTPGIENVATVITWLADEKVLLASAAALWVLTRASSERTRFVSNTLLADVIVSALTPHVVKRICSQKRPDRVFVAGHLWGIPFSGRQYDAFPSGHAVHVGAICGSIARLFPNWRRVAMIGGIGIAGSRVVLLAHWLSDVAVGLAAGILVDRTVSRMLNGPPGEEGLRKR
ncbi:phosphatase PAP2 family protein [Roseiarcaceae bacterium H3SJ34-1]|uniref:phosphatase PAP2 family protein n=1 Tax=Terripilifer ovatus TaxID=3032367 RepID=UPI003AB98640|nr:phosphatase PAP2 family protein [Roseiarcaceae bacterium H3SJ34-1]